jgi:hypothetical protein
MILSVMVVCLHRQHAGDVYASSFARAFKAHYGVPPKAFVWRRQQPGACQEEESISAAGKPRVVV